ncbi:hypothetical protein B7H23_12925 [Notoacmeibacter marinus]|uniref:Bacteriophage Mu GpT domain-containing protein n=1 Tax=Notoacmeibacter marinus TaxID=1876515 RepID=A0A231UT36_9HYPH|nr:prohead protease/major capsid protein fusion protein [Notoacmeibacter marinus]OXS99102.1 hypothetical protein B7H23_12925 [Notoacmeibacter marinus]
MPEAETFHRDLPRPRISSFDPDKRTVEVCWAAAEKVKRHDYRAGGAYLEELVVSADAVESGRLDTGAVSLVDTHSTYSMADRAGVVVAGSVRYANGKAYATVKLSRHGLGQRLADDLADDMPFPVSVGYRILAYEEVDAVDDGQLPTRRITRWEPLELTACPVQADPQAHSRSFNDKEGQMADQQDAAARSAVENSPPRPTVARQNRTAEIIATCRQFNIQDETFIAQHITAQSSDSALRNAILDSVVDRQEASPTFPIVETREMQTDLSDRGGVFQARQEAIACRMTGERPSDVARQFMETPLIDHARAMVESDGRRVSIWSRDEVLQRAMHTTSDFPLLLQSSAERVLLQEYERARSPIRDVLTRQMTRPDFRPQQRVRITDMGELKKVNEHGEIKSTTRGEVGSTLYPLDEYGRIFSLTRKAIINDDLGALSDFSRHAGRATADTENQIMFDLFTANDGAGPINPETGQTLFHAEHGNLGSAVALSTEAIGGARATMRQQRGNPNGDGRRSFINVQPKYLVVGPLLETLAEQILATIYPPTVNDANVFSKRLELLVEPRIEDHRWYLFADPAINRVLECSYLAGSEGPKVATQDGFEVTGVRFRVLLDFGAGAVDYHGAYRNPGLAPS